MPADDGDHAGQDRIVVARRRVAKVVVQGPRVNDVVVGVLAGVRPGRPVLDVLADHAGPGIAQQLVFTGLRFLGTLIVVVRIIQCVQVGERHGLLIQDLDFPFFLPHTSQFFSGDDTANAVGA